MKQLLLALFTGMVYSTIYQDAGERNLFKGRVIYKEENACVLKVTLFTLNQSVDVYLYLMQVVL